MPGGVWRWWKRRRWHSQGAWKREVANSPCQETCHCEEIAQHNSHRSPDIPYSPTITAINPNSKSQTPNYTTNSCFAELPRTTANKSSICQRTTNPFTKNIKNIYIIINFSYQVANLATFFFCQILWLRFFFGQILWLRFFFFRSKEN